MQVLRCAEGAVQQAQAPQELERQRYDAERKVDAQVVVGRHVHVRRVSCLCRG